MLLVGVCNGHKGESDTNYSALKLNGKVLTKSQNLVTG